MFYGTRCALLPASISVHQQASVMLVSITTISLIVTGAFFSADRSLFGGSLWLAVYHGFRGFVRFAGCGFADVFVVVLVHASLLIKVCERSTAYIGADNSSLVQAFLRDFMTAWVRLVWAVKRHQAV